LDLYNASLLREILDAQLEMVCRFKRDGTILFVNRAYAVSIGADPDDLTGKSLWNFVSVEDRAHVEAQVAQLTPQNPERVIENRFETATGTRWTTWRNHALRFDDAGHWIEAQSTGIDITERKRLEQQRELLAAELNHRVRNTLMVVQGMAYQSFKGSDVPADALAAFNARLHALAAAHTVLSRANWEGAELAEVVRQGLTICRNDSRVSAAGPAISLHPNAGVALVLVLHELATNALKYGALSAGSGSVEIGWSLAGAAIDASVPERLELVWAERGGPPVDPPAERGFGSRLIADSVKRQLEGEVELVFAREGLSCLICFPIGAAPGATTADVTGASL
jgi:PAS domain S-box-containing protein